MYKLLIIDDHQYITDGILKLDLNKINISFSGSAGCGKDGLSLISEKKPDIVIVDIELPDMTGIDIIKASKEICPDIKFIILSGHSEFSYAKEAISLNVVEYILKPVLPGMLLKTLTLTVKEIENKKLLTSASEKLSENLPVLKEKFIEDLFSGKDFDEEDYLNQIKFLGLPFENKLFKCILIKINFFSNPALSLKSFRASTEDAVYKELSDIFKTEDTYIKFKNNIGSYLIYFDRENEAAFSDAALKKSLLEIIRKAKEKNNIFLSFYIGCTAFSYKDIKTSMLQAKECLKKAFLLKEKEIVFYSDIEKYDYFDAYTESYDKAKLSGFISSGDIFAAKEYVMSLLDRLANVKKTSAEHLKSISVSMYYTVLEALYNDEIYVTEISELTDNFSFISAAKGFSEINEFWEKYFNDLENVIFPEYNVSDKIVNKVKNHISKHYAENITLDGIAHEMYCSPSYISSLFLKKVGISYKAYLTSIRMKKAYELLSTGKYKVYEVSGMVGYKKTDHFRNVFQRYFNINPGKIENSFPVKEADGEE